MKNKNENENEIRSSAFIFKTKFLKKNKLNFIILEKKVALACFGILLTPFVIPFEQKINVFLDYSKQIGALA